MTSVSNADGTLTISPTTGVVVASIALGHANTWSAKQTFSTSPASPGAALSGSEHWGDGATTGNSTGSTVLGNTASAGGNQNTLIGQNANSNNANVIGIGVTANPLVDNSFVAGSPDSPASLVHFGIGYRNNTPTAYTIAGTYGFGTNVNGSDINIAGGRGTGTGAGGSINFQTAAAGSTGSALNALSTVVAIGASGKIDTYNGIATQGYGVSAIVTKVALTNQAADITTTNFTNAGTAGLYRVSYSILDTTADATAGAVTLTIAYTDDAGATTTTATQVLTGVGRTSGSIFIQLASGNITYGISHTGLYGTAKYALYAICERLN